MNLLLFLPILLPIIFGILIPFLKLNKKNRDIYVSIVTIINSIIVLLLCYSNHNFDLQLFNITNVFSFGFKIDGLSKIFSFLLAILWPLATIYATSYMKHENNEESFFRYYTITYGIAVAVAFSKNLLTLYLFYELLTFITLPLIMHKNDDESIAAGRFYLIISIFGASVALMGIIFITQVTNNSEFVLGIFNTSNIPNNNLLQIGYVLCFIGFGVKAAIFPFTVWLPKCGVAPTPVTALLHAVAVVKSGVFAVMRVTYCLFPISILKGTYAQYIPMVLSIWTIVYASVLALKNKNIKKRLAYSTASNLSYILFAISLMTIDGFVASMVHMVFHGIIKITLFFIAGYFIVGCEITDVRQVKGLAKSLPKTFVILIIASLGLIGIPLTCGFISKYYIGIAAISTNTIISIIGFVAVAISAILSAIYMFTIIIPAYFPGYDFDYSKLSKFNEPDLCILIPLIILAALIIIFGISPLSITDFITSVANTSI